VTEFEHLHVHTQYSLLESALRVKDLCTATKAAGGRVAAMTDHANMHGVLDLYKKAKEVGVRPAFGCELAFALPAPVRKRVVGDGAGGHYHLVLLARDLAGYKNLIALVSEAWLGTSAGHTPTSTLERLATHAGGLVVLSGCLGGVAPQAVLRAGPDAGRDALAALRDACEPGQLFVELQDHGFREQPLVNGVLARHARDLGLPVVATNDAHYLTRDDAIAHRLLGCVAAGETLDALDRKHHGSTEMYLKTPVEMADVFRDYPDAVRNTLVVAERIGAVDPTAKPMLPRFRDADGRPVDDEPGLFARLCREGLARRMDRLRARGELAATDAAYVERLEFEIAMIVRMGFPGYFLIVQDFINWGKANGVPVGPGRGSGAGSLAAYALAITDLDPLRHGLLFERFLNPDRVSMPDFDVDFCMFTRDRVIDYVRRKYGAHAVGQIATFQLLKSKSVVRDVGRALGLPLADVDAVARLVPDPVQGRAVPIAEAIEVEPALKARYAAGGSDKVLLDLAQKLENLNRHAGLHAAGVVLSDGPLWRHVPVFRGRDGELVTQFSMQAVEDAGLVKFDFLGLTTLSVMDIAVKLINARPDRVDAPPFDLADLPLDDAETYALLRSGRTNGVFQLESSGMQKLFRDLQPDRFEDIVAAVALYRPGPLGAGMVQDFVNRKHGRAAVAYPHESLAALLEPTYGVIVYQEQVMQVARIMAGYSLGGADLLRRAMGKKKPEEMAKQRSVFVEGAEKNGHDTIFANKMFDMLEYFSGYGFNLSHSAAYGLLSYHTAYLKTHFPVEFLCATLTCDLGKADKVVRTIAEARAMGVRVLPPDVNESAAQFTVVYDAPPRAPRPRIRFGLGGMKGVGEVAVGAILEARRAGPFVDLFDFCARVDPGRVTKGVYETLLCAGAFDGLLRHAGVARARGFAALEAARARGKSERATRAGPATLFAVEELYAPGRYPAAHWTLDETLRRERAALGFYLSGHPLDRYAAELKNAGTTLAALQELADETPVAVSVLVTAVREHTTRHGNEMLFLVVEDKTGYAEVVVKPRVYSATRDRYGVRAFAPGAPLYVEGVAQIRRRRDEDGDEDAASEEDAPRGVVADAIRPLGEALRARARGVVARVAPHDLARVRAAAAAHPGAHPVVVEVDGEPRTLPERIDPSDAAIAAVEQALVDR